MKILITPRSFSRSKELALEILKDYDLDIIENTTGKTFDEEQMNSLCSDVDGVIVGIDPMTERVLGNAKNLKAISKYGAGLDNIDIDTANKLGIKVERAVGTNAVSVAELAIGLFFELSRKISASAASVKNGGWDRFIGCELTGKTAGIIGLGAIGRKAASMAAGIGMKVIAYDPYFKDDSFLKEYDIQMKPLDKVLRQGDYISLHVPVTEETSNMINRETLKVMKKTAFLINTSRGGLADEDMLYQALADGEIAGAAQDVFSKEPPGEHKLLGLQNFILTPHIGAYTKEANQRMVVQSTKNLVNMLFGDE